jgi:ABC-type transport system involved in cytochrome c biogenesis permease subunit
MTDQRRDHEPDEQARDESLGTEMAHWGREGLRDLGEDLKIVLVFLAAMVPAGVVGYLVAGGQGAFVGAIAGGVLLVVVLVAIQSWRAARGAHRWWRRRRGA